MTLRPWLDDLGGDLRLGIRTISRNLIVSAGVVITLTLGIGVSTGVFTVVNAVALRARVDRDRDTYFHAFASYAVGGHLPGRWGAVTLRDYLALENRARTVRDLGAFYQTDVMIGRDAVADTRVLMVTCGFVTVLPAPRTIAGRHLQRADCDESRSVIVLSEGLWRARFGSEPGIVGQIISVNDQPVTVIGVVALNAGEINRSQAWIPYTAQPFIEPARGDLVHASQARWLRLVGHARAGRSRSHVAAEFGVILSQQDRIEPGRTTRAKVTDGSPIADNVNGGNSALAVILALVLAVTVVVVLIACANVTTLLLSRADARRQEIGIRLAVGAGALRLIRMLLTETLILAVLAGGAALYLSFVLPPLLARYLTDRTLEWSLDPDWRVYFYLSAVTLLAGVASGLAPALQSLDLDLVSTLKGSSRDFGGGGGRRTSRARSALIGGQVALSFALLMGGTLFVRAYRHMTNVNARMETKNVLLVTLANRMSESTYTAVRQATSAIPNVRLVGFALTTPYAGVGGPTVDFRSAGPSEYRAARNEVSPEFLQLVGVPIVRGRGLTNGDRSCSSGDCSVVVSELLAQTVFGRIDAVGSALRTTGDSTRILRVVGVARDVVSPLSGEVVGPTVYEPWNPAQGSYMPYVRFDGDGETVQRAVVSAIRARIPGRSLNARTLQSDIDQVMAGFWRLGAMVVVLAMIATLLVLVGLYGVVSFAVGQRTRELGVRIALGAPTSHLCRIVVSVALRPLAFGLVIGLAVAVPGSGVLRQTLGPVFGGVVANDWQGYAATAMIMCGVAATALALPAWRAIRVDPLAALRQE